MKVIFICGALEPGRDGVGDYTRRLASELSRQGMYVGLIALNDPFVSRVYYGFQDSNDRLVPILRIPAGVKEKYRVQTAKELIDAVNPDYVSLQFVPFSFHSKGLSFSLAKMLRTMGKDLKWSIMLHELWVGMDAESNKKVKIWGKAQQYLLKKLFRQLEPAVIFTHTTLYQKLLEKWGLKVELLPLFSNIPALDPEKIEQKMAEVLLGSANVGKTSSIELVLFGGIHGGAPIRQLAREAKAYSAAQGLEFKLVLIGRGGEEQANLLSEWRSEGMLADELGELEWEKISERLTTVRFGIFTTPMVLAEKSSAVSVMREHGVQLLCVARPWNVKGIILGPHAFGIQNYTGGNLADFLKSQPDGLTVPRLSDVAGKFIKHLLTSK